MRDCAGLNELCVPAPPHLFRRPGIYLFCSFPVGINTCGNSTLWFHVVRSLEEGREGNSEQVFGKSGRYVHG